MNGASRSEVDHSADDVREPQARPFDLTGASLTPQVEANLVDVRDPRRAKRMALRKKTAGHIYRNTAPASRLSAIDQSSSFAFPAQTEILVMEDLGGREAVVQLDQVQVRNVNRRAFISTLCGRARDRVEIRQAV